MISFEFTLFFNLSKKLTYDSLKMAAKIIEIIFGDSPITFWFTFYHQDLDICPLDRFNLVQVFYFFSQRMNLKQISISHMIY